MKWCIYQAEMSNVVVPQTTYQLSQRDRQGYNMILKPNNYEQELFWKYQLGGVSLNNHYVLI